GQGRSASLDQGTAARPKRNASAHPPGPRKRTRTRPPGPVASRSFGPMGPAARRVMPLTKHVAVVKTAFLAAVSSLTCGCDPLPAIPVTSVAKALEDARRQGRAFRATSVEVELSVAYGVKGGVEVPVALPINFGGEYSAATKMKFVLADLSQDVTGPLEL